MGSFSRFYNAPNYQYTPQFVEQNLGVLDKALARKQDDYNKQSGLLDQYKGAILKQDALIGRDTEVRDKLVKDVQDFSSSMTNLDLTSPENKRKVNEYIQGLVNNEDIKKLNQGLASKAKYDKIKEDLVTKGKYASENDREFIKQFESYLSQKGDNQKFAIDYIGGKELIAPDAPSRPVLEKFVDNVHSNGYTYDQERGTWIDRKSNKGVSFEHLMNVLNLNQNEFFKTAEGQQLINRAEQYGVTPEEMFQSEITPIAAERAWKETSNTFRDNTARLARLSKAKVENAGPVSQPYVTNLPETQFKTHAEFIGYINDLKKSDKPEDQKRARELTGQKDILVAKAVKSLTPDERKIVSTTYESVSGDDAMLRKMYSLFKPISKLDNDYSIDEIKKDLSKESPARLNAFAKEAMAQSKGYKNGYSEIEAKMDKVIGEGLASTQQDLLPNLASQKVKDSLAKLCATMINDQNFDLNNVSEKGVTLDDNKNPFTTLQETSKYINPNTIKVRKGINGAIPAIVFSTKGNGNLPSYDYIVTPKDGTFTTAFKAFLIGAVGKEETESLQAELNGKNYTPIGRNETYSQTEDMQLDPKIVGKVSIVPSLSSENHVNINNQTSGGITTIGEVVSALNNMPNLSIEKKREYAIKMGLGNVISEFNGQFTPDIKASSPADFKTNVAARDYLALKQSYAQYASQQ